MSKLTAPPMVYIQGEEMTRYAMELILEQWVKPHVDISAWEYYDFSVKARDASQDQVLKDAIDAGSRIKSIFKEPTITPTQDQVDSMGLSKKWPSPNGAVRRGWNGVTISRDTIHIKGIELGYKKPVLFDRHAVGGEYGGGWAEAGPGKVKTIHTSANGTETVVDERELSDDSNVVVTYHNPLDGVEKMAHHFFSRSLEAGCTPVVSTKKTVFAWQETFWKIFERIFNEHYADKFKEAGVDRLAHEITDAMEMKMLRWKEGGFSVAAHNYDGDMLTDLMSEVHRSAGFISSALTGVAEDGTFIMEFEASHGTVTDMDQARLKGEETSLNPIGLVDAALKAMNYSAKLKDEKAHEEMQSFTETLRKVMYNVMTDGRGTRDLVGKKGTTTEQFIGHVAEELNAALGGKAAA